MSGFILTSEGLIIQAQVEALDELIAKIRAQFGPNLNVAITSIMGQILNIEAEDRATDQEVVLAVYRSFDPATAIGVALDARASLTGSVRKGQQFSTAEGLFTFSGAAVVPNGAQVRLDQTETVWEVINGPIVSAGPGTETGQVQAVDPGEITALTTPDWSIITVIANWDAFENTEDADLGRLVESDSGFRARRQIELFSQGEGPLAAIKANVSRVNGVDSVRVYHNPATNPVDADGIPFKAGNVVVETTPNPPTPELQQLIFDAMFFSQGLGGQFFGTDFSGVVIDPEGVAQPVAFDLVAEIDVFVRITLTTSTSEEPITPNLNDIVAARVLETGNAKYSGLGSDVKAVDFTGEVQNLKNEPDNVTGIDGILTEVSFDGIFYVTTKLAIGIRERADYDSARIFVSQV